MRFQGNSLQLNSSKLWKNWICGIQWLLPRRILRLFWIRWVIQNSFITQLWWTCQRILKILIIWSSRTSFLLQVSRKFMKRLLKRQKRSQIAEKKNDMHAYIIDNTIKNLMLINVSVIIISEHYWRSSFFGDNILNILQKFFVLFIPILS